VANSGARLLALVGAVSLTASLAGCGDHAPTRSVEKFCSTYSSEKAKFQKQYSSIGSGGSHESGAKVLTDLILGFQSLGDVSVILDKVDKVAPDDIEPDVSAVQQSWKDMQSTLGDEAGNALNPTGLVGAIFKGTLMSIESNGSWQRVGNYVQQNCSNA
jgi:uncharacterized lipoprotein YehR (DUF1307 family)